MVNRRDFLRGLSACACSAGLPPRQSLCPDDEALKLQHRIDIAARSGLPVELEPRVIGISRLSVPSNTRLIANGATLMAVGGVDNLPMMHISGQNVTVEGNLSFALQGRRSSAVLVDRSNTVNLNGAITVWGPTKTAAKGFNGGVLVQLSKNIRIGHIIAKDLHQHPGRPGLFRALGARFTEGLSVGHIKLNDGDMCTGIFSCRAVNIASIQAELLTDNGLYLDGDTSNVFVDEVDMRGVEEGVVFYCRSHEANITINRISITSATNKGISLRTGGGYAIEHLYLDNALIGQPSKFSGVTSMKVENLFIRNTPIARKILHLGHAKGISFGHVIASQPSTIDDLTRVAQVSGAAFTMRSASLSKK